MIEFKDVLKELMKDSEINILELSKKLGIANSLIAYYLSGKNFPSFKNAYKIAKYFKVSFAFLFALSNDKEIIKTCNKTFYEIYTNELEKYNTNNLKFCRENEIDLKAIRRWRVGIMPSMKNLIKISYAFVINIDYLIGDKHYTQINETK